MLDSTLGPSEPDLVANAGGASAGETIGSAFAFLRRRYLLLLVAAFLGGALAVAYLKTTTPTFTASAQILLDNPEAEYVRQDSPIAQKALDIPQIETQIQIVRSSAIATAVIKKMDLTDDPDFNRPPPFLISLMAKIRGWISGPEPARAAPTNEEMSLALIPDFLGRLDVRRVGLGRVIEISFSASSAARAASIANAVAAAYINDHVNARFEASKSATGWLQDRLQELGDQARTAAREVDAYKAQHNIVSSGGESIDDRQVADLNSRLVAASAQTADALARVNSFQGILSSDDKSGEAMGAAVTGALNSSIISGLRTQFLDLQRREIEWAARYGKKHLAVVELRARMKAIRDSIRQEVLRLSQNAQNDYELSQKREQAVKDQLAQAVSRSRNVDSAEVALRSMQARAKGYQTLYDTFQQRYVGALQSESFPISEARVITTALPPSSKSKPKSGLILGLGAIGGLAFGLALGFLRDVTDGVFRTAAQVEAALRVPCFSLVPLMPARKARRRARARPFSGHLAQRRAPKQDSIDSNVIDVPFSRYVECIRAIKIGIDLNLARTGNKVIGVTSTLPNEGKTTVAASLARLIAHSGKRVIILDCDLRKPSLSSRFAPEAAIGLMEVVDGRRRFEDAIWTDPASDLVILPVVPNAPVFHTSEFLSSEATRALVDRLRESYDYVILDLPPLSPLVDARATSLLVDGFVLVVEWGETKVNLVRHALHNAPNVHENVLGAVLNKTDMKAVRQYDVTSHSLYDNRHYAHYGDGPRL
jgi:exopolysaccharide transport family protein